MNRLSMEVPIFFKLRMLWNGPLRNLATQPVSWPVKIETALVKVVAELKQQRLKARVYLKEIS
jgi:hypothetical protein